MSGASFSFPAGPGLSKASVQKHSHLMCYPAPLYVPVTDEEAWKPPALSLVLVIVSLSLATLLPRKSQASRSCKELGPDKSMIICPSTLGDKDAIVSSQVKEPL